MDDLYTLTRCLDDRKASCMLSRSSRYQLNNLLNLSKLNSPYCIDVDDVTYSIGITGLAVYPNYLMNDVEYSRTVAKCDASLNRILNDTKSEDPVECLHRIYAGSCRNMIYSEGPNAHTVCGPLLDRSSVCEGFAKFILLVCKKIGLPCVAVPGRLLSDRSQLHAWNQVLIDDQWYNLDLSSDISSRSDPSSELNYFLISDNRLLHTHEFIIASKGCANDHKSSGFYEQLVVSPIELRQILRNVRESEVFKVLLRTQKHDVDFSERILQMCRDELSISCRFTVRRISGLEYVITIDV